MLIRLAFLFCFILNGAKSAEFKNCFDCYRKTICDISGPIFLKEAIDIGILHANNDWLSNKYPKHDFGTYLANPCWRNRVRNILAAFFKVQSPVLKPGCSGSDFCDANGCSQDLKNVTSSPPEGKVSSKHDVNLQTWRVFSQLTRTILLGSPSPDKESWTPAHVIDVKYLNSSQFQIPTSLPQRCLRPRELSTVEKVDLTIDAAKTMFHCGVPQPSSTHGSSHRSPDDYILIELKTLNRLVSVTAHKQPKYSIKNIKNQCRAIYTDDLYIAKSLMLREMALVLVHCNRCGKNKLFGNIENAAVASCNSQHMSGNIQRILSITNTLASFFREWFDCRFHQGECKFVSQNPVSSSYNMIRHLLGCYACNTTQKATSSENPLDNLPPLANPATSSLRVIEMIARNTMDSKFNVASFGPGDLVRGLQNLINFHRILEFEAQTNINQEQLSWQSCHVQCTVEKSSLKECDECRLLGLVKAFSSLSMQVFSCTNTFKFQKHDFCKPGELENWMNRCLVDTASQDKYTALGKEVISLLIAFSSLAGSATTEYENSFSLHQAKYSYLDTALGKQQQHSRRQETSSPAWLAATNAVQPAASAREALEKLYMIAKSSETCSYAEEFCSESSQCMPIYQNCQPLTKVPDDQMYPLIGQVDMTVVVNSSFFISDFISDTIIAFESSSFDNHGHWMAFLPSGVYLNVSNAPTGVVLSPTTYLKFHSHKDQSYGVRLLHFYRAVDLLSSGGEQTTVSPISQHNNFPNASHFNTDAYSGNSSVGDFVDLSQVNINPRRAVLLINPIKRTERIEVGSNFPNWTITEDSRMDKYGTGFRLREYLDLKVHMTNDSIPKSMHPYINKQALDMFYEYKLTHDRSQPIITVVSLSDSGHWHVRFTDERNRRRMINVVAGKSFPVFNSAVFFHPAANFHGVAWLYFNASYNNTFDQQHNTTSINATVTVLSVNDKPTTFAKVIQLPSIAYNLTASPNTGFNVSQLGIFALDLDDVSLGIAVLAVSKSMLGKWYYQLGSGSWTEMPVKERQANRPSHGHIDVIRLLPGDRLKFELSDASRHWSYARALKEVWLHIEFWDMTDGKSSGSESISMADLKSSSAYSSEVFCYMARLGCDGKIASTATIDACGVCGGSGRTCRGCDGVPFSGARFDSCGKCTGGGTGKLFDYMRDCAGTCGKAERDDCNICQRKGSHLPRKNFKDCAGVCFGKARLNKCGHCYGGSSSLNATHGMDVCGVCNGDGTTCQGCDGIANSGRVMDLCGGCLLPNDAMFNANCTKIHTSRPRSSPSSGGRTIEVYGAGFSTHQLAKCYFERGNASFDASPVSVDTQSKNKFNVVTPAVPAGAYAFKCIFDDASTVYQSIPSTFRFYSKSIMRVNRTNVERIPINQDANITVFGSNLNQTDEIFCAIRAAHGQLRIINGSILSSTSVICPLPSFSKSANLMVTVVASREDANPTVLPATSGNAWLAVQIYAPAPVPTIAKFSSNLEWILVTFNAVIHTNTRDCSKIFRNDVASKLGQRSRCYLKSLTQFIIKPGYDSSIAPGDILVFKGGAIWRRNQIISDFVNSSITVQPPAKLEPLIVLIYGPPTIGSCETLRIKAVATGNTGRTKLSFKWSVQFTSSVDTSSLTPNDNTDMNLIQQYLGNLPAHSHRIAVSPQRIQYSTQSKYLGYEFAVYATNSIGQTSNTTTLVVERMNAELPTVKIIGGTKRKIKSFRNLVLRGHARHTPCSNQSQKSYISYQWEVSSSLIKLDSRSKNTPRLFVPRKTLKSGETYTFTFTASLTEDPTIFSSASVEVVVDSSPLVAKVKGGSNRVIGSQSDIVLDASRSYDPDKDVLISESFSWECYTSLSEPCFIPDPNNTARVTRLDIPPVKRAILRAGTLLSNQTYTFVFTYNKGSRSASKTIRIKINPGTPPLISIRPQRYSKANSNRKTVIRGYVQTFTANTAAFWECVEEDGYSYLNLSQPGVTRSTLRKKIKRLGMTSFNLVLNRDTLEHGSSYKFKLKANNVNGNGFAETTLTVNGPPTLGILTTDLYHGMYSNQLMVVMVYKVNGNGFAETTLTVNGPPTLGILTTDLYHGVALDTLFRLQALEGWVDDQEDMPLTYDFGYIKSNGDSSYLGSASEDNELTTYLPAGDRRKNFTLSLFVDVSDNRGATTRAFHAVRVLPITKIDMASVISFASKIESAFAANDLSAVIGQVSSTVNVLNEAGHLDGIAQAASSMINISSVVHDEIVKFKENMTSGVLGMLVSVFDRKSQDAILNLMADLTRDGKLFKGLLKKQIATSILNLIKQQTSNVPTTPAPLLKVAAFEEADDAVEEDDGKTSEEVAQVVQTFENIINVSSVDHTAMALKNDFTEMTKSLLASMCKKSSYGEDATVSESTLSTLQSYKYDFGENANTSVAVSCKNCSKVSHDPAMVSLGDDLTKMYESWQCTAEYKCNGACLGSVQYPADMFSDKQNGTLISDVVQVNLFSPESSQLLVENSLTSPMTFLIPVQPGKFNSSYSKECRYWDEVGKVWKNDSCVTEPDFRVVENGTFVVCKCTRTGTVAAFEGELLFSAQVQPTTTAPGTKSSQDKKKDPLIPLYVVLGILGIIAVAGGSFYAFKMRRTSVQQTQRQQQNVE